MKLIINADDFGLTLGVSEGIIEGMKHGVITETSAIVNSPYFLPSAKLAKENDLLEMGLHCLLTVGVPISKVELIPSLIDENGMFYSRETFSEIPLVISEVEIELEAQIEVFLSSGLKLNHLTTHHGFMDKTPEMKQLFIKLAKKYNIPIRNEWSRKQTTPVIKEELQKVGLKCVDKFYINSREAKHSVFNIIEFLNNGNTLYETLEIGCHPGYSDDILRMISILNDEREDDLKVFLDQQLREYIKNQGIKLISYSQL